MSKACRERENTMLPSKLFCKLPYRHCASFQSCLMLLFQPLMFLCLLACGHNPFAVCSLSAFAICWVPPEILCTGSVWNCRTQLAKLAKQPKAHVSIGQNHVHQFHSLCQVQHHQFTALPHFCTHQVYAAAQRVCCLSFSYVCFCCGIIFYFPALLWSDWEPFDSCWCLGNGDYGERCGLDLINIY